MPPVFDEDEPSATIGDLAQQPGARLTFDCRPCCNICSFDFTKPLRQYGPALKFEHFKKLTVCGRCRMPVDGQFRLLHYITDSQEPGMGWSGPK